jgi:putative phosphoesterase
MDKLIGVIADTHNLLRPEIIAKLKICDLIIHAGDIGEQVILKELTKIQKIVAVRGNMDRESWARRLKDTEYIEFAHKNIVIIHNLSQLFIDPKAAGQDIVIYGHSHQPAIQYQDDVLYLNPGSAGPRRFKLPISMAYLRITDEKVYPEIIEIEENQ